MKDGQGTNEETTMDVAGAAQGMDVAGAAQGMDVAGAAAIMAEAGERARRRLEPGHRVSFAVWGLLWFVSYGTTWLIVRGRQPFHEPSPAAWAVISLLAMVAALAAVEESRTETGLRGLSVIRRRAFALSAVAGYAAMIALLGALVRAGAGQPVVSVFEAAAPVMVIGMLVLVRSVLAQDWPVAGLGLWLVIAAAASGYAGPRAVWGVGALAVALGFWLVAAFEPRLRRA